MNVISCWMIDFFPHLEKAGLLNVSCLRHGRCRQRIFPSRLGETPQLFPHLERRGYYVCRVFDTVGVANAFFPSRLEETLQLLAPCFSMGLAESNSVVIQPPRLGETTQLLAHAFSVGLMEMCLWNLFLYICLSDKHDIVDWQV